MVPECIKHIVEVPPGYGIRFHYAYHSNRWQNFLQVTRNIGAAVVVDTPTRGNQGVYDTGINNGNTPDKYIVQSGFKANPTDGHARFFDCLPTFTISGTNTFLTFYAAQNDSGLIVVNSLNVELYQ